MKTLSSGIHKILILFAGLILATPAFILAAQSMELLQERTAAQHAEYASNATKIDQVHLHLHHVINCLVGPKGKGFDAKAGNPCKDQGNGALNKKNLSKEEKQRLKQALSLSKIGVKISNEKAARDTANAVRELLQESAQGM